MDRQADAREPDVSDDPRVIAAELYGRGLGRLVGRRAEDPPGADLHLAPLNQVAASLWTVCVKMSGLKGGSNAHR